MKLYTSGQVLPTSRNSPGFFSDVIQENLFSLCLRQSSLGFLLVAIKITLRDVIRINA